MLLGFNWKDPSINGGLLEDLFIYLWRKLTTVSPTSASSATLAAVIISVVFCTLNKSSMNKELKKWQIKRKYIYPCTHHYLDSRHTHSYLDLGPLPRPFYNMHCVLQVEYTGKIIVFHNQLIPNHLLQYLHNHHIHSSHGPGLGPLHRPYYNIRFVLQIGLHQSL